MKALGRGHGQHLFASRRGLGDSQRSCSRRMWPLPRKSSHQSIWRKQHRPSSKSSARRSLWWTFRRKACIISFGLSMIGIVPHRKCRRFGLLWPSGLHWRGREIILGPGSGCRVQAGLPFEGSMTGLQSKSTSLTGSVEVTRYLV